MPSEKRNKDVTVGFPTQQAITSAFFCSLAVTSKFNHCSEWRRGYGVGVGARFHLLESEASKS